MVLTGLPEPKRVPPECEAETRREGKPKGINGVWCSVQIRSTPVILLGSILLILQILHVSLSIIVVARQLAARP